MSSVREAVRAAYETKSGDDGGSAIKIIKDLIEAQGRAFEEFKGANDKRLELLAKGQSTSDLEAKLAKIEKDMGDLAEAKQVINDLIAKVNRPNPGNSKEAQDAEKELKSFNQMRKAAAGSGAVVADIDADAYRAYTGAFWALQRKGNIDWLTTDERKAMSVGQDADGGYLVPAPTVGKIVQKVYELSPIRAIASVMSITGDALEGVNDLDEAACGWVGETDARSDTNTPQVGKYRIEAMEMYASPKVTQKLLDDAGVDIEAWLADKVANKFARTEAAAFITGNGINKPRGFTTYTTAATGDATRTWGQLEHVGTGNAGDFASSSPADVLFDLIMAFKPYYLNQARWVTRREVIAKIRKLKEATTNAYMWQPGLQAGQPDKLVGYPILMAQDMPALASGSLSMALGDFGEGYQIVDRFGMRTLRDPFTDKPYVKFYTTRRCGGAVTNFEAIKFIKFS